MAIAVRQTASNNTSPVTFGSSTLAGSTVIACIGLAGGVTPPSVAGTTLGGSAGNFASLISSSKSNGFSASEDAEIWADPNCAGGQTSVAITTSGTVNFKSIVAYEITGLLATNTASALLDQSSSSNNAGSTSWTSNATATTTNPNEIWIGCVALGGSPTGPSSPWTNTEPVSDSVAMMAGYKIVTSTGAATYNGTQSSSFEWACCVVTLLPAIGGGGLLMVFP